MKCQFCNGLGYVFENDFNGQFDMICPKCKGKKEVDENGKPILTNEEYLRSCNTEDLAIFLCNNLQEDVAGTLENRFFVELYHQYPINPMNAYHEVMKWLKENYVDGSNCGEK